jgi:hypothetical protein
MKIAYFLHDLSDASASRRAEMLRLGGAQVAMAGFRRGAAPVQTLAGLPVRDLGRSFDGALAHRARLVARHAARPRQFRGVVGDAKIVLARNLEMLAIAATAQRAHAPAARLVYECLDIHRLMSGEGIAGAALRAMEGALLRRCSALLVSAPAFLSEHFEKRYAGLPRVHLVENKLLPRASGQARPAAGLRRSGPPWRIGWFGNLRCRRSLELLLALARESRGSAEIVLRGRPSPHALPDFAQRLAGAANLRYEGPYAPGDLEGIYRDVHFVWGVDFTDEGLNSDWLLPNRLYEGGFFNTPAIAERRKATGRWLAARNAGLLVDDPLGDTLRALRALDRDGYLALEARTAAIATRELAFDASACRDLVAALQ